MSSQSPLPPSGPAPNPAEIAREAFRRLAAERIAPTPQAYTRVYREIAGLPPEPEPAAAPRLNGAEFVLAQFALRLSAAPGELAELGRRCERALKAQDWPGYALTLTQLQDKAQQQRPPRASGIELAPLTEEAAVRRLRELLSRTLTYAVAALLDEAPALAAESAALGAAIRQADSEVALSEAAQRLKQLCYQIELSSGDAAERRDLLLRLFKLLLDNVNELIDDDNWMRGQIDAVQQLIAGPLEPRALESALRSLKDVVFKQSQLKHSLSDARLSAKHMMATFIDRLGQVAASAGDFHDKIGQYADRIGRAGSIEELNPVLDEVLRDTRAVQGEALRARDNLVQARQDALDAEERIQQLEAKLQHMSELAREDQLTGSLNRRGLDDVFEREMARADRRGTPLCIAMLDLDDFKRLNDTYGHLAGDGALKHLVRIIKDTLRSMDVIARFGGEEFLILLPETTVEAAAHTMTRLQRELTRHFFLHDNEKLLITFSAGVALRQPDEDQTALIQRADQAMQQAKQSGKNRVVVAP